MFRQYLPIGSAFRKHTWTYWLEHMCIAGLFLSQGTPDSTCNLWHLLKRAVLRNHVTSSFFGNRCIWLMCDGYPQVRDKLHMSYQHWFPLFVRPWWIGMRITLPHSFHRLTFARSYKGTWGLVQHQRLCPEALNSTDPWKLVEIPLVLLYQALVQIDLPPSSTLQVHAS